MTILEIGGSLSGTLDTTVGSPTPQPLTIVPHAVTYGDIQLVGTAVILGNPTGGTNGGNTNIGTPTSPVEIPLGTSLYFKNNGTIAHVGLTQDVIVNPDGTTARFFGKTYTIGASLTVSENNWSPAGIGTANVVQISASQYLDITGIASGTNGQELVLQNTGTMPIRLTHNSGSSLEPFLFNRNVFLNPSESTTVLYDSIGTGWRPTDKFSDADSEYYGSGKDGTATISSTVTLSRDMYYSHLTLASGGTIFTNGWKIYVSEIFDVSQASAQSIQFGQSTVAFTNGTFINYGLGNLGTEPGFVVGNSVGGGGPGLYAGTTGNQSSGGNGGLGGNCVGTQLQPVPVYKYFDGLTSGIQGGCGGGEHPLAPTGGGGGVIWISARYVNRGTNGNAGFIYNPGGTGANGGGGGWVYFSFGLLLGTQIANAISAPGGASNYAGGTAGNGGRITLIDLTKNLAFETIGSGQTCLSNL